MKHILGTVVIVMTNIALMLVLSACFGLALYIIVRVAGAI